MSLNAIKVENLRAKKTDYRVADGGGLYLLVRPNESKGAMIIASPTV